MSKADADKLVAHFGDPIIVSSHHHRGDETVVVQPDAILQVMRYVKNTLGYDLLVDLTAVDRLGRTPRFEVVYHLRSMQSGCRLRIKAGVNMPELDEAPPSIASMVSLWPIANWLEREAWDMYGIRFVDHPDLRRILLYEEFVGHPLRKDYPKDKRQPLIRRENLLPDQTLDQPEAAE